MKIILGEIGKMYALRSVQIRKMFCTLRTMKTAALEARFPLSVKNVRAQIKPTS